LPFPTGMSAEAGWRNPRRKPLCGAPARWKTIVDELAGVALVAVGTILLLSGYALWVWSSSLLVEGCCSFPEPCEFVVDAPICHTAEE
jgi:hypothetical protein